MNDEEVWPPAPRVPDAEEPEAEVYTQQKERKIDWAALLPGMIVVGFLALCFLLTLWFLGRLAVL